jgi:integrase
MSAPLTSLQAPPSSRFHQPARIPATVPAGESLPLPAREVATAAEYARAEKAEATRRAYRSDFEIFRAWCAERHVSVLPASPESVAAFLAHEAEHRIKPSTIGRRVAAIRYAHKLAELPLPTDAEGVKATMRGIRRTLGSARIRKAPAVAAAMLGMVAGAPDNLAGLRDRALLLLGFAGAFRRSELVALDVNDIEETEAGLRVTIRYSKTDQDGQGVTIAIARGDVACPVKALRGWLDGAGIDAGPLFRPINKAAKATATPRGGTSRPSSLMRHGRRHCGLPSQWKRSSSTTNAPRSTSRSQ